MTVLFVAEHDHAALNPASRHGLGAARQLGATTVLVAGHKCRAAAEAASRVEGVGRVLIADAELYAHPLAETLAPLVAGLARGHTHVLAPATTFGKNLMPRVAALLDVAQISDIVAIEGPDTFVRPIYAGNALLTVRAKDPIKVVTVRATAFAEAAAAAQPAPVEAVPPAVDPGSGAGVGAGV
jgi:electron transfer flavoprotein alpha subunit